MSSGYIEDHVHIQKAATKVESLGTRGGRWQECHHRWNNSTRAEQYCQSVYVWIVLLMEYVDSSFGQSESQRINSNMGKALPPV